MGIQSKPNLPGKISQPFELRRLFTSEKFSSDEFFGPKDYTMQAGQQAGSKHFVVSSVRIHDMIKSTISLSSCWSHSCPNSGTVVN